ncbi:MAG: adenylosuccinate lyase [Planctomycetes bacterium]|nr:adenylosuccinate lyase [Planctomycetota bacterium]
MAANPSPYDTYTSPLATRNASEEMLRLWSARHKFNTWRRIWLAVAEAQYEMGLPVTKEQVEELRAVVSRGITDDEIRLAEKYERELRHDVMAHVHALGDSCPKAKGIIHLGMTSQDVVCNADRAVLGESLALIAIKLARAVSSLGSDACLTLHIPTLGFTHYQAAQPLTVGRRIAQWSHDLSLCEPRLRSSFLSNRPRGLKGATGTQAAFLELVRRSGGASQGSSFVQEPGTVVDDLNRNAIHQLSWENWGEWLGSDPGGEAPEWNHKEDMDFVLTSQTYPRVIDTFILADLASVAAVLHKIATDIRLLCNRKEIDEPFEDKQIGSSAMPYKRNPMRCERICGLSRFVMNLVGNAYDTAATQWLERTLDDSSNRRLSLPEAFLALDGALDLMHNVASGLIVHEAMVKKNLMAELPFMATENIMMECVKLGGDRQHYHELIRQHAQAAGLRVKQEGLDNDLLDRLKNDKSFWSTKRGGPLSAELNWDGVMDPMKYVGRSVEQTERFIKEVVEPLREQYKDAIAKLGTTGPRV